MDQMQTVQRPMPTMARPPMGVTPQPTEKKSGWLKWVIIILVLLILGMGIVYLLTP